MSEKNNLKNEKLSRRSAIKNGATLVGAGMIGAVVPSQFQQINPNNNHFFNIKDFGASGKREIGRAHV